MATAPEEAIEPEDDVIDLGEEVEEQHEAEDDDEIVLEIEGENDADQDTPVIRQMREQLKAERAARIEAEKRAAPKPANLRAKPKLSDFDYDEEAYEADRDKWDEEKRAFDSQETAQQEQARRVREDADKARAAYQAKAAALPFKDFKQSEDAFVSAVPEAIQMATIKYLPDAEKVIYALGARPAKLAEIGAIQDPIAQLLAIKDFGAKIVMRPKTKAPPAPDRPQSGSGSLSVSVDKEMQRLEKEADRTGDRSKLIAYRASMRK